MDLSLGRLIGLFLQWQAKEVAAHRARPATLAYYRRFLHRFGQALGDARPAGDILPLEVELWKSGWHSVQAVQRLYNWGLAMEILDRNPFRKIQRPPSGQHRRVLAPWEAVRLLRHSDQNFRPVLLALQHTLARPQEVRAFRGEDLRPGPCLMLWEYKARTRRKDRDQPCGWRTLSSPPHHHEPRLRPALGELQVLQVGPDLGPGRLNGLDDPALGEGIVQFLLRYPPRPLLARLFIAETH